jgi:hypothetical protein
MDQATKQYSGDRTLGQKVEHLKGICGHQFPPGHTRDGTIAMLLDVTPETWARIKVGKIRADADKLGRIATHFRLAENYGLDYSVFLAPTLEDFKALLARHHVGLHGGETEHVRAVLARARQTRREGIVISVTGTRGGLAGAHDTEAGAPVLRPGDTVTLRVAHPDAGHLLLLNYGPERRFDCLMPSRLAPGTEVTGRETRLPTRAGSHPAFQVDAPCGAYTLYGIWTRAPLALDLREALAAHEAFHALSLDSLRALTAEIEGFDQRNGSGKTAYEIRIAHYEVSDARRRF